jgi:hypothetical protein
VSVIARGDRCGQVLHSVAIPPRMALIVLAGQIQGLSARSDCGFAYSVLACLANMQTRKRIFLLHSFDEIEVGQNSVIAIQT